MNSLKKLALCLLAGMALGVSAQDYDDDIYYAPKDKKVSPRVETGSTPVNNNGTNGATIQTPGNQPQNGTVITTNPQPTQTDDVPTTTQRNGRSSYDRDNDRFDSDDYYDYEYAARLRRFYGPSLGMGYYDSYFTNSYWYTYNPYNWGLSIYLGSPWWGPSYYYYNNFPGYYWGVSYGNPYFNQNPYWTNWGWGCGYYGHYWGGYNNGFNNGYWNGYWNGFYAGANNSYYNNYYYNSFDNNTSAPRHYYGPRSSGSRGGGGNTAGNGSGRIVPKSLGDVYVSSLASENNAGLNNASRPHAVDTKPMPVLNTPANGGITPVTASPTTVEGRPNANIIKPENNKATTIPAGSGISTTPGDNGYQPGRPKMIVVGPGQGSSVAQPIPAETTPANNSGYEGRPNRQYNNESTPANNSGYEGRPNRQYNNESTPSNNSGYEGRPSRQYKNESDGRSTPKVAPVETPKTENNWNNNNYRQHNNTNYNYTPAPSSAPSISPSGGRSGGSAPSGGGGRPRR